MASAMGAANLVSVIIACHNQGDFLGEAVASILNQSYCPWEIIVVDDGSTDNTSQVAATYSGINYLRQANRGVAAARNAGLQESQGSFIVFLDADDRLLPGALTTGVASLVEHPECAFVYGHVNLIGADGAPLPPPPPIKVVQKQYVELLRHNHIWTAGAVMYRRSVLDSIPVFDSRLDASADLDLNLRIASRFPIYCHNNVVLEYRRHEASMSRDFGLMLKTSLRARRAHKKYVLGNKLYESALTEGIRAVQQDYGEKLMVQVRDRLRARKWIQAVRGLVVMLRYYPRGFFKHLQRRLSRFVFKAKT
jgi:glycosyltransferase involved in cell wall biosynthesis